MLAEISVGILLTVTVIVALDGKYLSLPLKLTVTVALPSPTAVTMPWPFTRITLSSLTTKDKLPALEGIKLTTGSVSSPISIFKVLF